MTRDFTRFLTAAKSDRFYALYVLALTTGLRQSELFGLQWSDVDFKDPSLRIQRAAVQLAKDVVINPPKTKKSRRRIVLTDLGVSALRGRQKEMLKRGLAGVEWVFCNRHGGLLRREDVRRLSFKPLLKKAGVRDLTFHDLRHSVATVLLSLNIHPKIVQEILGHSNIAITMDTYSHVIPGLQEDAIGQLGKLMGS